MLLAGDRSAPPRPVARFVLSLACLWCGARYMTESPLALPLACGQCGSALQCVAVWDLLLEARPAWWRGPEEESAHD
jgi:hypothetical protein